MTLAKARRCSYQWNRSAFGHTQAISKDGLCANEADKQSVWTDFVFLVRFVVLKFGGLGKKKYLYGQNGKDMEEKSNERTPRQQPRHSCQPSHHYPQGLRLSGRRTEEVKRADGCGTVRVIKQFIIV